jgi:hypothetical protein
MTKCSLFQKNITLLVSPYRVQSSFSLSIFRKIISAFEGNAINITDTNFTEFQRLCEEFDFTELAAKLSEFRPSMDFKETENPDTRGGIAALEKKANQHSHVIAILQSEVTQLSTDFGRLVDEVSALRSAAMGLETYFKEIYDLTANIIQRLSDPVVKHLSTEFRELQKRSFDSESGNCIDFTHCHSIFSRTSSLFTAAVRSAVRFADHFRLSEDLGRVPKEAIFASVARQSRWFR